MPEEIKVTVSKSRLSDTEKVYVSGIIGSEIAIELELAWELANRILIAINEYRDQSAERRDDKE